MQRYFSSKLLNNELYLKSNDSHHIKNVMRMKLGDLIEVVYNNKVYICSLQTFERAKIVSKIDISFKNKKINLIIPLLKDKKMSFIFQKATELGVDSLTITNFKYSDIKLTKEQIEKRIERYKKICEGASRQSKRNFIPKIEYLASIKEIKLKDLNLVCIPNSLNNLKKCLKNQINYDKLNVVIGPAGGISNNEEEYLKTKGFSSVSLGSLILRTETVPLVVLSMINYEYME